MGKLFTDRFSVLHFATGMFFYTLKIPFTESLILHILFEFVENSKKGIEFINTFLKPIWPGGKDYSDSKLNSLGDTLFFMAGWIVAKSIIAQ